LRDALQAGAVSFDRCAGDCVDHWVDLVALPHRVESREGHAGLGPQCTEDQFAPPGGTHGRNEIRILPGVDAVRSIGGLSSRSSANSGTVGLFCPELTFTVDWTIGNPNNFAVFTVVTMFFSRRAGSIDRTDENCVGW
jgi:hypothetical protein